MRKRADVGTERQARWVRGCWALAAFMALGSATGLLRLEPRFDPQALLDLDDSVRADAEWFGSRFGDDDSAAVFVLRADDVTSAAELERMHRLSHAASALGRVTSLSTAPLPHAGEGDLDAVLSLIEAAPASFPGGLADIGRRVGGELVVGPIVPRDTTPFGLEPVEADPVGSEQVVAVGSDSVDSDLVGSAGDGSERPRADLTAEQRALLVEAAQRVGGQLVDPRHRRALVIVEGEVDPDSLEALALEFDAEVTGLPLLQARLEDGLASESVLLVSAAVLLSALLLLVVFRSPAAVAFPLLAAGLTLAVVMGAVGWSGVGLTLLTAIVPPVLLTIAVGDSLHLLMRFSEERRTLASAEAAERTQKTMWRACLATSLTTAIGFGALVFADTQAVRAFALIVTLGVLVAFLVVMFVVPALLRRTKWKGRHFDGTWIAAIALGANRRRALVIAISVGLAGVCALGVTQLDHGTRLLAPFGEDDPYARLARELDADFGGVRRMQFAVEGALAAGNVARARDLGRWLETQPEVRSVRSATSLLDEAWDHVAEGELPPPAIAPLARIAAAAIEPFVHADGQRVLVTLQDVGAERLRELGEQARAHGADRLGGEAWHAGVGLSSLQQDLLGTFGLAFAGVFLVIGILFGFRRALIAMPPNVLPMFCIVGWMGLRGIPLDVSSAMVFAVTLGLVVDGTLHLLARLDEDPDLGAAYRSAGVAVVIGGVLLLAGFASLFFSELQPLVRFAELATVAIVSGLLCELLLLPALLPRQITG